MKTEMNRITAYLLTALMLLATVAVPATAAAAELPEMYYLVGDDSKSGNGLQRTHYEDAAGNTVVFENTPVAGLTKAAALPAQFSSVSAGIVTPVRNQGDASCCWAFSALSAMEIYAVKNGYSGVNDTDYSEAHLGWFSGNSKSTVTTDPMYGDGILSADPYTTGNFWRYTVYTLAKGSGINYEKDFPFNGTDISQMGNYPESTRYSHSAGYLTGCQLLASDTQRKEAIRQYGAITMSYGYYEAYENNVGEWVKESGEYVWHGSTCAYMYDGKNGTNDANHTVTVVGWDDNYPVSNFAAGHRPKAAGAWLCKNSWGVNSGWGENGYFWLSYEDPSICDTVAWQMTPADEYDGIYQYDGFGWHGVLEYDKPVEQANIFTATGLQDLNAVGFYTAQNNVNATVRVYTGLKDAADPASGTLAATQTYTAACEGYHTVTLKTPVSLIENQKFAVVVEISVATGTLKVPVEGEGINNITCNSVSGTSYIKFSGINRWFDSTETGYGNNPVKAYYESIGNGVKIYADNGTTVVTKGTKLQLISKCTGAAKGQTVVWSTSSADIATVDANGLVTGIATGNVTVTATCGEYSDSFTLTVAPRTFTLTWTVDGTVMKQETLAEGSPILVFFPSKNGYNFGGWNENVPTTMPPRNVTLTGSFVPKTYTVKWVVNGKTTETTLKCGDAIIKPDTPQKSGSIFVGWTPSVPAAMPAMDMTFTAVFKVPTVTIIGFAENKTVDYKTSFTFASDVMQVPQGTSVYWYINGENVGTNATVKQATKSFTVQAKLVNNTNGSVIAESGTEHINVKTDFISKFIAAFRGLVGALPKVTQNADVSY